ncbi:MAG: sensor histidine kinase [Burkholderiaceae bacterium]
MNAFVDHEESGGRQPSPADPAAAEPDWQLTHQRLEQQMRQRTAELTEANQRLQAEIAERRLAEQMLLESQQQLRHLAAYQERVREDERKRIAREIHDDLGQNMLALRIDVLRLQVRTANRHPALNQRVGAALQQIDRTIKSVRGIVNNLRPPALDFGLQAAIEWQIKDFRQRSGLACELDADGCEFDAVLDESRALALFRILQESLTNVARHARASRVGIELRREAGALCMKVRDDGVGMDLAGARKSDSFGLLGIRERVGYLQGKLAIDSSPGQGTTLTVSIPLYGAATTI